MQLIKKLYTFYCLFTFTTLFLILFPFFLLMIAFPPLQKHLFFINQFWGRASLFLCGFPLKVSHQTSNASYEGPVIYCANHFSLLDIITFAYARGPFKFMGKNSLAKIPLFGFMFRKLHIAVKRGSASDAKRAMHDARKAIDSGFSLVIFPEGGIYNQHRPVMSKFKDGAFVLAIEKQIPIVPVCFPDNGVVLPDEKWPPMNWRPIRIQFLSPVSTIGLKANDLHILKEDIYKIIQNQLDLSFNK